MKIFRWGAKGFVPAILFYALILVANQTAFSQYVCQPNGAPIVTTGSISAADPLQATRINRDGTPSSCTGGAPVAAPVAGSYNFDQYPFTNPTGVEACVVVDYNMTACGGTTAAFSTQVNAYSTFVPTTPNVNVIGEPGFSTVGTATLMFRVAAGASFVIVVHNTAAGGTCASYTLTMRYHTGCRQAGYDRTSDGKADPAYFVPTTGIWNILNSAGGTNALTFGQNGDTITPGDYTGDGQTDVSTYRGSNNTWYYATDQISPQTNVTYVPWGIASDVPVPGDYDRDGKTDVAIWRPGDGTWYILRSSNNTLFSRKWGVSGDTPVTGDYDGDLINDFTVVRTNGANRQWFQLNSNFAYGFVYGCGTATPTCGTGVIWGTTADRIVTGDFDGDARSDIGVYRADGTWHYLRSSLGAANATLNAMQTGFVWGLPGDIPQPADYDGDKRTDFATYRPTSGVWYISNSNNGAYDTFSAPTWGGLTDQPASSPYLITNP